jgi:hypothetical protein
MGQYYVNWDDVSDTDVVPKGIYQAELVAKKLAPNKSDVLMATLTWSIQEPDEYAGQKVWERLTLGTTEDPDSVVASTFGTKNLKKRFKALAVPSDPDVEAMLEDALGQSAILSIDIEMYQGREGNTIKAVYPLGDRVPSVGGASATETSSTPLAGRPTARRNGVNRKVAVAAGDDIPF